MDDIYVARVMAADLATVAPDAMVEDTARLMLDRGIGSVIVVDADNHLEGILTTTDFVRIVAEREPKDRTPVSAYMTTDVVTVGAQVPIQEAAETMIEHGVHHLPVVDETAGVVGIVTTTDLTAYLSHVQTPGPGE